ncbi:LPXTG cell wall anchor domain-containing protein [Leucobacter ruminantium]|uniref:LPXTG cell wall anchor domain-containing protein n=1 Tax=Leucobacter ruminantium TaxID=1289170 RepID=A0A939RXF8_9MICO|nr:LPXTG cell wall anchor domain-containing protein [Leucobacter ruminantium]MBO1803841.1 LPXTG cell wall anchor domain-containing protein [Leucobacter ruminantium]
MRTHRLLALGTAAALALGGIAIASPAFAVEPQPQDREMQPLAAETRLSITTPGDSGYYTGGLGRLGGTAVPGAQLNISAATDNRSTLDIIAVGPSGDWSVTMQPPLMTGNVRVEVSQYEDGGSRLTDTQQVDYTFFAPVNITSIPPSGVFGPDEAVTRISGTVDPALASRSDYRITPILNGASFDYTMDDSGNWSVTFPEPLQPGNYSLVVQQAVTDPAVHSSLSPASATFTVAAAPGPVYAEVTIDGFSDDLEIRTGPVAKLDGTGEPGAWIEGSYARAEDPFGPSPEFHDFTAQVSEDGTWSYAFPETIRRGIFTAAVHQYVEDETWNSSSFVLALLADPSQITSIAPGQVFTAANAPNSIAGTVDPFLPNAFFSEGPGEPEGPVNLLAQTADALAGSLEQGGDPAEAAESAGELLADAGPTATPTASSSFVPTLTSSTGASYPVEVDENGDWSADLGGRLPVGEYTMTFTPVFADDSIQEINHLDTVSVSFSVVAGGGSKSVDPGTGKTGITTLPSTGGASLLPYALGAAGLLLIGGAALFVARRRNSE